ncbi:MAG: cyclic nucleotide-binding domain-containing protein [Spirochaetales bacterium]|nr:cyclic nucleotide-binding domain-containing protein [Spirochaetales bacterium]
MRLKDVFRGLIVVTSILVVLEAPLRAVYHYDLSHLPFDLDLLTSALFGADLCWKLYLAWRQDRTQSPGVAMRKYLRGWFWLDLLTAIPFHLIILDLYALQTARLAHLVRYLQVLRGARIFHSLQELRNSRPARTILPGILRLILFAFWALIGTHWIACGWLALSNQQGTDLVESYIAALYWTVTTLSTVGYGDITPANSAQRIYAMIVMMLGVGAYTFVIGNVASVLGSLDFARSQLQEKQDRLMRFLRRRHVPEALQIQIADYFTYLIDHEKGYEERQLLSGLPHALYSEISLHLHFDLLKQVPFLQNADERLIRELVERLEAAVYPPDTFVFRKGDHGNSMFFISKGSVDITSGDGSILYATLHAGQFFGEMALLLKQPRTASVRAREFCELYELKRGAFRLVTDRYREFRREMEKKARERQKAAARRSK